MYILDFDPATADAGAVKELESRAARMPRDPILQARRGAVFERAGAWDQAATAYEKALQLNTNLVPVVVKRKAVAVPVAAPVPTTAPAVRFSA